MHLIEQYALNCGVKIGQPFIVDHFFPLPFDKYITIHNTAKFDSRNYNYWPDVVEILKRKLHPKGYKIVQVGSKEDPQIPNVDLSLLGQNTFRQMANVIRRAALHVGIDSLPVHMASMYDIPIVALYSNVYVDNSRPYWSTSEKVKLIESDRNGDKPTFSPQESPKTINNIVPEKIAYSVFDLLGIDYEKNIETLYIGEGYHNFILEVIPDAVLPRNEFQDGVVNLRMDLHFNEEVFFRTIATRKVSVITDKPIDLKYVRPFKQNVVNVNIELNDSISLEYVDGLRKLGIPVTLGAYDLSSEEISALRFKFFDYKVDDLRRQTKDSLDFADKISYNSKYKSNKFILSRGKAYLSKADWKNGKPVPSFKENTSVVTDSPDFWEELDHYYIYNE